MFTRHWALDVECSDNESGIEHNSTCSMFSISIKLTDEGLEQVFEVSFYHLRHLIHIFSWMLSRVEMYQISQFAESNSDYI